MSHIKIKCVLFYDVFLQRFIYVIHQYLLIAGKVHLYELTVQHFGVSLGKFYFGLDRGKS